MAAAAVTFGATLSTDSPLCGEPVTPSTRPARSSATRTPLSNVGMPR